MTSDPSAVDFPEVRGMQWGTSFETTPESSVLDLIALIRAKHEFRRNNWFEDSDVCATLARHIAADLGAPYPGDD
ncbi:MAG: hypothetical protein H6974_11175 [Gammaproteobacteria bacterium]|nr:hypothetical protein [Gammaproteobacteria bacterium]